MNKTYGLFYLTLNYKYAKVLELMGDLMKFENNRRIINVNDNLNIIMSNTKNSDYNYYVSLIIRDKQNIKHCINISIELMENNLAKIPTSIIVSTGIVNNFHNKHSLEIRQICDNIDLLYDGSVWEKEKLDAKDIDTNDIIDIITNYLNSFNELHDDINLKTGLHKINTSLTIVIDYVLDFWRNFDIDSFIEQQKEIIQDYQSEYLKKVTPIQNKIELLNNIKKEEKHTK